MHRKLLAAVLFGMVELRLNQVSIEQGYTTREIHLKSFGRLGRKLGNLGKLGIFFPEIFKFEFSILAIGQNR